MCEILTDNRNRTAGEVRKIFEKSGGNLGSTGCVAYNFQNKGQLFLAGEVDEEKLMEVAIDAGADDVREDQGVWEIITEPAAFLDVRQTLEAAGFAIDSAEVTMIAQNTVELTGGDAAKALRLIDALEDHDDVQKVHTNVDISDDEMAKLEA